MNNKIIYCVDAESREQRPDTWQSPDLQEGGVKVSIISQIEKIYILQSICKFISQNDD